VIKPAIITPRGIVLRGFFTSCPENDPISKPENAKHIADHRLSVVSTSSRGTRFDGANDVADPYSHKLTPPAATSSPAGIHVEMPPRFCSQRPAP
jgi:hypothetical protein